MRSIGLIVVSTKFTDIKYLLQMIFTIAIHAIDGNNYINKKTQCEKAKKYLKTRISTHEDTIDFTETIIDIDKKKMRFYKKMKNN